MTITPAPNWRGDPVWLPEALRAYGVTVKELPGWKQWGNGDFAAIKGIIVHHTGHNATSAEYIARNPGLGNALSSQIHLSRDGVATICGAGIAWHAGRGSYPGWQTNNANWESIGIEAQSDGTSPWPAKQLDAYYRICAAILTKLGKRATTQTLIAHWEYSRAAQGKWDPGAGNGASGAVMDMNVFRSKVNWYIDNPPWKQKPKPAIKEIDVNIVKRITDFITAFVGPIGSDVKDIRQQLTGGRDKGQYPGWAQLGKNARGGNLTLVDGVAALRSDVARLEKKIDAIAKEK
ncbi:N-acetylmuramoyl-L-alanine amidase [Corynebacterium auriscanis]|uniref:peptidoglycan recognition protein family protein n=1 Tax=Corynebacterium auriscanis TaxID=99807 RepID=UPI003CEDF971